jgi:plasmid replication initiation protein
MNDVLTPDKNKKTDFFICDVFDVFKDDTASMEHPVFSLSTKPDHRMLVYENNGNVIKIKPSYTGLATIHDKDILLYLTSCLMNAKNNHEKIHSRVRFTAYDYLASTNKPINGKSYIQLKQGLERLSGTRIETNIKTHTKQILCEFGLIDNWCIVKENQDSRMIAIEVKLSEWFYNSILGNAVLSIDKDYFQLRKPTDRRLYELARKHCGNQNTWKISLEKLKDKIGSNSSLNKLRFNIKKIAKTNHLPEYNLAVEDDVVIFTRKAQVQEETIIKPKTATKPKTTIEQFVQENPTLTRGKTTQEVLNLMAGRR